MYYLGVISLIIYGVFWTFAGFVLMEYKAAEEIIVPMTPEEIKENDFNRKLFLVAFAVGIFFLCLGVDLIKP